MFTHREEHEDFYERNRNKKKWNRREVYSMTMSEIVRELEHIWGLWMLHRGSKEEQEEMRERYKELIQERDGRYAELEGYESR